MPHATIASAKKGADMDLTATTGYVAGFPQVMGLRDLGGLQATDGRRVRHGMLYRGSALVGLANEQKELVDGFGLRFILDLRAAGEAAGKEDYVPSGASYLRIGGMYDEEGAEVDFSPAGIERIAEAIAQDPSTFMRQLYASMMFGNPAVHELVRRFVAGEAPLYFHCTAGKDRTGVCAAVLLTMLGVPDDEIVREFLLTNEYRAPIINMAPEDIPAHISAQDRENWSKINSVQEVDLRHALAAVDERFATREAYFAQEFGIDAATLAMLRDAYLT